MMDSNFNLTYAERSLLDTVRHFLGNNFSDFLPSGLGEAQATHRCTFTAQSISPHVDARTYQFEMISKSSLGLPFRRDPLVLAARLDLLCERQPLDSTILFRVNALLQKLQWPHDAELEKLIKQAVERYTFTAYCLIDSTVKEEHQSGRFLSVGRLLIGYSLLEILATRDFTFLLVRSTPVNLYRALALLTNRIMGNQCL